MKWNRSLDKRTRRKLPCLQTLGRYAKYPEIRLKRLDQFKLRTRQQCKGKGASLGSGGIFGDRKCKPSNKHQTRLEFRVMILGFSWGAVRDVVENPLPPHHDATRTIASDHDRTQRKLMLHFQPCSIHPGSRTEGPFLGPEQSDMVLRGPLPFLHPGTQNPPPETLNQIAKRTRG